MRRLTNPGQRDCQLPKTKPEHLRIEHFTMKARRPILRIYNRNIIFRIYYIIILIWNLYNNVYIKKFSYGKIHQDEIHIFGCLIYGLCTMCEYIEIYTKVFSNRFLEKSSIYKFRVRLVVKAFTRMTSKVKFSHEFSSVVFAFLLWYVAWHKDHY